MYNLFPFWHAAVPEHPPSSVSLLRHRTLIIVILLSKPLHTTQKLFVFFWDIGVSGLGYCLHLSTMLSATIIFIAFRIWDFNTSHQHPQTSAGRTVLEILVLLISKASMTLAACLRLWSCCRITFKWSEPNRSGIRRWIKHLKCPKLLHTAVHEENVNE